MAEEVRGLTVSDEIEEIEGLAYVVLRTVNRMQAKGSTVRIVTPRDPEVAHELGMDPDEDRLLRAVEYLLEQGYVVPAGIDLPRGDYTIAPAGLEWLEMGVTESPQAPGEEAIERVEDTTELPQDQLPRRLSQPLIEARRQLDREPIERPWWRRLFGGCRRERGCPKSGCPRSYRATKWPTKSPSFVRSTSRRLPPSFATRRAGQKSPSREKRE